MQLGAPTTHPLAPKIAALHHLRDAGLPVPDGAILLSPDDSDPARWSAVAALLHHGSVIVRTALFGEDTTHTAAAGLGASIPDCTDEPAIHRALAQIHQTLADPWLQAHLGAAPRAQILIQRQIHGPWLAVVAQGLTRHAEIHPTDIHEPLAAGATPTLSGPLDLLPIDLRRAIVPICERVTAAMPTLPHGLDLELAADTDGTVWVVQARPLTRPLHPFWPAFAADAARSLGAPLPEALPGLWNLDAEHNPAPLSPAHAGLIRLLAAARPDLVTARVLAGWLYEPARKLSTDNLAPQTSASPTPQPVLDAPSGSTLATSQPRDSPSPTLTTPQAALDALRTTHIPAARAWLTAWDLELARADDHALAAMLPRACDHLLEILATYATLRAAAPSLTPATHAPLCLRDRQDHLDVLPATWDIASPTLADLSLPTLPKDPVPSTIPDDPAARLRDPATPVPSTTPDDPATLLRELDDHLFALGLAPLRRLYLRAGLLLELPAHIFLFAPDELPALLRNEGPRPRILERRAAHARQAELFPPLQLLDGLPVPPAARTHLQGLPIGPPVTGPLHPRRDLADLLARPLPPDAILAIPALTAQAAVALHALAVRAVCCEHGGAMSHAALMARELGLSALIGCRGCTDLAPGTRVHLDTRTGRLRPT